MIESLYDPAFPPNEPATDVLVSIVLPTHQRPVKLSAALAAIADQEYQNVEVIVVFTPDSRTERLLEWFKSDTSLDVIPVLQTEGGMPHARNMGIERASGDIVVFTDDDCIPPQNWLSAIVWTFENKDVVSVGGIDYPHPSVAHRFAARADMERKLRNQVPDGDDIVVGSYDLRTFGGSNVAYDASSLSEHGIRHDEIENRENDGLFQKRVLDLTGGKTAYIPVPVLHTRDYTFRGMLSQYFANGLSALEADGGRTLKGSMLGLLASPVLLLVHIYRAHEPRAGIGLWISDMAVRFGMVYGALFQKPP